MTEGQVFFVAAAFAILLTITLAVQFQWLRDGRARRILIFLSGLSVILSLRIAGLPPVWFSASATGFGLAVTFLLSAFVARDARSFAVPLFLGLGLTLLAVNLVELGRRVW